MIHRWSGNRHFKLLLVSSVLTALLSLVVLVAGVSAQTTSGSDAFGPSPNEAAGSPADPNCQSPDGGTAQLASHLPTSVSKVFGTNSCGALTDPTGSGAHQHAHHHHYSGPQLSNDPSVSLDPSASGCPEADDGSGPTDNPVANDGSQTTDNAVANDGSGTTDDPDADDDDPGNDQLITSDTPGGSQHSDGNTDPGSNGLDGAGLVNGSAGSVPGESQ